MKTTKVQSIIATLVDACSLTVLTSHASGRWHQEGTQPTETVRTVKKAAHRVLERLIHHGGWGDIRHILIHDDQGRIWILHGFRERAEQAMLAVGPLGSGSGPWTVGQILEILATLEDSTVSDAPPPESSQDGYYVLDPTSPRGYQRRFQIAICDAIRMGDPATVRILAEKAVVQWPKVLPRRTQEEVITKATGFITLCEEAAIRGGLDPLVVEEMGERYAGLVKQTRDLREATLATMPLLHQLAEQVSKLPFRGLSAKSRSMIRYVLEHLDQPITLADAARFVGLSPNYAGSLIRQESGKGFLEFTQGLRIHQAQRFLKTTDWPIGTIAQMVGYRHPNQFARAFRTVTGQSPRDFRHSGSGTFDPVPFYPDNFLNDSIK